MTTSSCPWCGMRGPDFDESPRPSDYCGHDDAPLLQDQSRGLSRYLANAPHARQHVREAAASITVSDANVAGADSMWGVLDTGVN